MSNIRRRIENIERLSHVGACNHSAQVVRERDESAACPDCGLDLPIMYIPLKTTKDEWIELAAANKSAIDLERMFSGSEAA
jgi:hypothetical protein